MRIKNGELKNFSLPAGEDKRQVKNLAAKRKR
jgi:hypothetical protein